MRTIMSAGAVPLPTPALIFFEGDDAGIDTTPDPDVFGAITNQATDGGGLSGFNSAARAEVGTVNGINAPLLSASMNITHFPDGGDRSPQRCLHNATGRSTISLLFIPTTVTGTSVLIESSGTGGTPVGVQLLSIGNALQYNIGNGSSIIGALDSGAGALSIGVPVIAQIQKKDNLVQLWVDGVMPDSVVMTGAVDADSTSPLSFGRTVSALSAPGYYPTARIDDTNLTEPEMTRVRELMTAKWVA